jgi:hypothetical protein
MSGADRSQVQGSMFRVKDEEEVIDPNFFKKCLFPRIIVNLALNFELGLTKLMLFS